jgi:hypothetical protein
MRPHFVDSRFTDGGVVVSLTRRPAARPLPPGRFPVLISVRGLSRVRLEILGKLKKFSDLIGK